VRPLCSHLATSELFVSDPCQVYRPAKRYYAEIMMRSAPNREASGEAGSYDIEIVAPSHGRCMTTRATSWVLPRVGVRATGQ
jgi:flavorubredoxin